MESSERALAAMAKADKLSQDVEQLTKQLDRVLMYMEDDEKTGHRGFVSRLASVELRLDALETIEKISKGKKSVYFFLGSAVVSIIIGIIKSFDSIVKLFN